MTLPHQHSVAQIQEDWEHATAQALESGRQPLLELGMDRRLLYNLPRLSALERWDDSRTDLTEPLMLSGGIDALWPVPLLYPTPPTIDGAEHAFVPATGVEMRTPVSLSTTDDDGPSAEVPDAASAASIQLTYAGADQATYLASLTTHAAHHLQSGLLYAVDLPAAMQPIMHSHGQPHVNATWSSFPLTFLHLTSVDTAATQSSTPHLVGSPSSDDLWLARIALMMIVLLVLFALLI